MAYNNNQNLVQENHHELACGVSQQTNFCVPLTFGQQLTNGAGGVLIPLSNAIENTYDIRGVLKLKFDQGFSKAIYKLYVFNALNRCIKITGAQLNVGAANNNGPTTVILYGGPGRNVNGLLATGQITNNNIISVHTSGFPVTNSVASLYLAIRTGQLFVNVDIASPNYTGGIIRGQVYLSDNIKKCDDKKSKSSTDKSKSSSEKLTSNKSKSDKFNLDDNSQKIITYTFIDNK